MSKMSDFDKRLVNIKSMEMKEFSISVIFNQKGKNAKLASYLESLIIIKDFLKENFPHLLNNIGTDGNSIEFDNYRISVAYLYSYFQIGFIDVNKIDKLQEKTMYLLFDKILHFLNDNVKDGRINDYINNLQLKFVFNQRKDNCVDFLRSLTNFKFGENVIIENIFFALTYFNPHKTNITFCEQTKEIYSSILYRAEQFIDVNGKDIYDIRNVKNEILKEISSLTN